MIDGVLRILVVYKNPSDYPNKFVVREHRIHSGGRVEVAPNPVIVCDDLLSARQPMMDDRLVRFDRSEGDDGVIVETWL